MYFLIAVWGGSETQLRFDQVLHLYTHRVTGDAVGNRALYFEAGSHPGYATLNMQAIWFGVFGSSVSSSRIVVFAPLFFGFTCQDADGALPYLLPGRARGAAQHRRVGNRGGPIA